MTVDAWERGLASQALLLSQPPYRRQGWTELVRPANPAAGAGFTRKVPNDAWERLLTVAFLMTTSAVSARRIYTLSFQDGDGFTFAQVPFGVTQGSSLTQQFFGALSAQGAATPESGAFASASVTSPAAGATIAATGVTQGLWVCNWEVAVSGTVTATEANNFSLTVPSLGVITSENGIVVGQTYPQEPIEFLVPPAGGSATIKAIALGTVGAIYTAQLTCQQLAQGPVYAEIPDLVMKSGWQYSVSVLNEDAADQLSAIGFLVERYPSSVAAGIVP